ncbi:probable flavin-containing monoamine oxidase A [Haliotis rubra]|uniref:probable flavin-containing monoamine oxidase A n=1 Tax=Haliotis rubra TaxID=36100 RepID=UPI001EE4EF09|nr:probable flavin-containing monoamine oxidase A [Haliotis rubra]
MSSDTYDAIIVGAGISGLTAAHRLKKKDPNIRVLVIEAKDRVGGRTYSVPLKTVSGTDGTEGTDVWDLGSQWVGRCQTHVMSLLSELELETYHQYSEGSKFVQLEDHSIRTYTSTLPTLSFLELMDLRRFINKKHSTALWCLISRWTAGSADAIDAVVRYILGVEASQVSLLFFLMYVNSADGLDHIVQKTEDSGQDLKIKGGAQQICEKLAAAIGDNSVLLKQPVSNIKQESEGVIITTSNGTTFKCKRAIVTIPPSLLNKVHFEPILPICKRDYISRAPLSNRITAIVTFRESFWRDRGWSGEILSSGGQSTVSRCDSGPLCFACDATSADDNPAIIAFIGGHQAVQWGQLQREERKRGVLESLSRFFGPDVFGYVDYAERDWSQEPYTDGGPLCVANPGAMMYYNKALRQPFGKIHFAGTETATVWIGTMNGAVQAGLRAATEVLRIIKPEVVTPDDLAILTTNRTRQKKSVRRKAKAPSWVTLTIGLGSLITILIAMGTRDKLQHLLQGVSAQN